MNAPCRRRAIWAAQVEHPVLIHEPKHEENEVQKDAGTVPVAPYMCPKCNREYRRGMYFHQKYCRGL